jgi:hypothetical protein
MARILPRLRQGYGEIDEKFHSASEALCGLHAGILELHHRGEYGQRGDGANDEPRREQGLGRWRERIQITGLTASRA